MRWIAMLLAIIEGVGALFCAVDFYMINTKAKTIFQQIAARQSVTTGAVLFVGFVLTLAVLSLDKGGK